MPSRDQRPCCLDQQVKRNQQKCGSCELQRKPLGALRALCVPSLLSQESPHEHGRGGRVDHGVDPEADEGEAARRDRSRDRSPPDEHVPTHRQGAEAGGLPERRSMGTGRHDLSLWTGTSWIKLRPRSGPLWRALKRCKRVQTAFWRVWRPTSGPRQTLETRLSRATFSRRARQDSNLRPLAPEASALSTELRAPEPESTGPVGITPGPRGRRGGLGARGRPLATAGAGCCSRAPSFMSALISSSWWSSSTSRG